MKRGVSMQDLLDKPEISIIDRVEDVTVEDDVTDTQSSVVSIVSPENLVQNAASGKL